MKFPTMDEFAKDVAEKALDEYEYKGKTLRQWIEIISASEHGTDLAEVGTDCISRQQVINALSTITMYKGSIPYNTAVMRINQLPPIQPEIIRCKDCKYARLTNDGSCKYCDIWFPDEAEYMDGDYYCASAERKSNG